MSNDIVFFHGSIPVTSTMVIAEQTQNEHASVIKLVRTYLADLEEFGMVGFEIQPRLEGRHGGGDREIALLNEQQSTLLITYMRNSEIVRAFKKRLVKAFFELAGGRLPASQASPNTIAASFLENELKIASLFSVPKHLAEVEAVKACKRELGRDYSYLLKGSPAQDNVKEEEVFLEPNDLAEKFGMTHGTGRPNGFAINQLLQQHGYQQKIFGQWQPTDIGAPYCKRHQWAAGNKSGYNYKWQASLIEYLLDQ